MKKIFSILIGIFSILLLSSFTHDNVDLNNTVYLSSKVKNTNKQVYNVDGNEHTIYWAKGVDAPLMTDDESKFGTSGYFEKDVYNDPNTKEVSITYQYPYENGHGYYDLNKDFNARPSEKSLCYLGSGGNMLLYWLEQNKSYINQYLDLLQKGVYGQGEGLRKILPYDQSFWDMVLEEPTISVNSHGLKGTELINNKMITRVLTEYYNKTDDGFFQDRVIDFFINGYKSYEILHDPDYGKINDENDFRRDKLGGLFYPVFGKERLSNRYTNIYIQNMNKLIKDLLEDNHILGIGYTSPQGAHALTLYGAEYDEQGNIVRFYVTDSDDSSNASLTKKDTLRGLHSMNVLTDEDGRMYLKNVINPKELGGFILQVYSLDLAQDKWETKLKDLEGPKEQVINDIKGIKDYPLNSHINLVVDTQYNDTGFIDYQWYKKENGVKNKLEGETSTTLRYPANKEGTYSFSLEMRNYKNGKVNVTNTDDINIRVDSSIPLKNAQKAPEPRGWSNAKVVKQYSDLTLFYNTSVNDGGTLTYQWYETNDSTLTNNPRKLKGETTPYLHIDTSKPTRRFFFCEVTNTNFNDDITGDNIVVSTPKYSRMVKVEESSLLNAYEPLINNQSNDIVADVNDDVILEVNAQSRDGGTLSYQWYKVMSNGELVEIKNATEKSLQIDTSKVKNETYKCKVINFNNNASGEKYNHIFSNPINVVINEKIIQSSDNKLLSLNVEGFNLNPSFDANINEYIINVSNKIEKINLIYALPNKASVVIDNPVLEDGKNVITINVIAENGSSNIYTINVNKEVEHNFGEWEIIKKPTTTETGLKRRVCEHCGEVEEETIDKIDVITPPTENNKPSNPDSNLPNVKPDDSDVNNPIIPEVKPENKPSKPDSNLPNVKPDNNNDVNNPIIPEARPEDKPSKPESDLPIIKPGEGDTETPILPDAKPENKPEKLSSTQKIIICGGISLLAIIIIGAIISIIRIKMHK